MTPCYGHSLLFDDPTDWRDRAACRYTDPELFFPVGYRTRACWRQINQAARICLDCPVRRECLDFALTHPELDGVWAGSTPLQRAAIRRNRGYKPVSMNDRRIETSRRREKIAKLHRRGVTPTVIAAELGVTRDLVNADIRRLGLAGSRPAPVDKSRIVALSNEGFSASVIAQRMGCHVKTVYAVLANYRKGWVRV